MNFKFTENTVIIIPITYKGYRLEGGEKVRFRCLFKNYEGDFPYTLDIEEDNKGVSGADGKYTITLDMGRYGIRPGRYAYDLSLVLESGSLVTMKSKAECFIDVIPEAEGLYKANGEVFFGADFIIEEGVDGSWRYRKYNSGRMEAWGMLEGLVIEIIDISNITGLKQVTVNVKFPKGMLTSGVEYCSMIPNGWYNLGSTAAVTNNNLWSRFSTWEARADGYVVNESTLWAHAMLIGRWK